MKRRITVLATLACALALTLLPAHGALGQDGARVDPFVRLASIDQEIAQALSDVEQAISDKARVDAELEGLVAARAGANRALRERTRALYRVTRAGVLPLAGGFDALLGHVGRVERLERMVRHDVASLRELRHRAEALRGETGRLAGAIEDARGRVAGLEAQKLALREEAQRAAVYATAFGDGAPIVSSASAWGSATGIRTLEPAPAHGFDAQRGQLALPLAAPRSMRAASREDGEGLELEGARGVEVRAAAAGRVAFSDRHPAYGRLVIIDHGEGYFTVYGGLARVDARIGDQLARGASVGGVEGEPLFFQVRRGTRAMDARAWLGI